MNETKTVAVYFNSSKHVVDVTLGLGATDAYFVETARAQLADSVSGRFRKGHIINADD